jgi:hypothetical protein
MKFLILTLTVLVAAAASCQSTPTTTAVKNTPDIKSADSSASQPKETAQPSKRDSATLAYELATKTWATNDDALSMMVMMIEGQDPYDTFEQRVLALENKGIIGKSWNLQADKPVTKGSIAFMICRATNIQGGVMMHLISCRRYAYRELVYRGMMVRGGEFEPMTGPELVGLVGRAARPEERL